MALSITHRVTGLLASMALGGFALVLCLAAFASPRAFADFVSILQHPLFFPINILIVWAFLYHLLNGLRHLIWDTGVMLSLPAARASGYTVALSSILLTLFYFYAL